MISFKVIIIATLFIVGLIIMMRYLNIGRLYMTSHYNFEKEYSVDKASLQQSVFLALEKANFKKIKKDSCKYSAIALPSLASFAEKIKTEIKEVNGSKYIVSFSSECILPTQVFDWGKNKRNSNRFFNNLNSLLIK